MYNSTYWKDHVVDPSGTVIQQGTNMSAENFNNMEDGIEDSNLAEAIMIQHMMHREDSVDSKLSDLDKETYVETGTVTLTNTQKYPFNNSQTTIALAKTRTTLNYTVEVLRTSYEGGLPGEIIVSGKAYNGFKAEFTGSATKVVLTYIVKGGFLS